MSLENAQVSPNLHHTSRPVAVAMHGRWMDDQARQPVAEREGGCMPAGLATFLLFCLSSLSFTHIRRRIRPRRPLRYLNRRCFSASRRRRATYSQHWLSASLCELNKYRAAWPLYKQGKFGSCVFLGVPPADTDWTTSASFYQTQISPVFDRGRFLTTLSDNEFGQRKPKFGHVLVGKFRP